ncbi:hypothetical protein D3C85_740090 [compost metagenome]
MIRHIEALAHPQIEQARLELQLVTRVIGQPVAADIRAHGLPELRFGTQRPRGVGGGEVTLPAAARHEGEVLGELQHQFVNALDVIGEQVALVVVQVALIANPGDGRIQTSTRSAVPGRTGVDQIAPLRLGAHPHAPANGGIERTADILRLEGEAHGQRCCAGNDQT